MDFSRLTLFSLAALLLSALVAALFTMLVKKVARRIGFLDRPHSEAHKQQSSAVALGGGVALMAATVVLATAGAPLFTRFFSGGEGTFNFTAVGIRGGWLLAAALLAGAAGLADDVKPLKAHVKFALQFVAAGVAVLLGGAKLSLFLPYPWLAAAITIFWFVALMNAVNFFDNMDGLASGMIAIAMIFFGVTAAVNGQYLVTVAVFAICGVCVGFYLFNRSPASIYLGDCGSHFLGFLAALAAVCVTYFKDGSGSFFPVLMPLLILFPIIFDAAVVCVVRTARRRPFWIGDNNHISHRFVRLGMSRAAAVVCVHLTGVVSGLGALALLWGNWHTAAAVTLQLGALGALILAIQRNAFEDLAGK